MFMFININIKTSESGVISLLTPPPGPPTFYEYVIHKKRGEGLGGARGPAMFMFINININRGLEVTYVFFIYRPSQATPSAGWPRPEGG
jgi:hypothetical protein